MPWTTKRTSLQGEETRNPSPLLSASCLPERRIVKFLSAIQLRKKIEMKVKLSLLMMSLKGMTKCTLRMDLWWPKMFL